MALLRCHESSLCSIVHQQVWDLIDSCQMHWHRQWGVVSKVKESINGQRNRPRVGKAIR